MFVERRRPLGRLFYLLAIVMGSLSVSWGKRPRQPPSWKFGGRISDGDKPTIVTWRGGSQLRPLRRRGWPRCRITFCASLIIRRRPDTHATQQLCT
jgi:hypothetical protein